MFFPKSILKFVKHLILVKKFLHSVLINFSRILDKVGRNEIRRQFLTICLFPDLKIGTTFAILKMDGNIPKSKARLKHKYKIGAKIPPHSEKERRNIIVSTCFIDI